MKTILLFTITMLTGCVDPDEIINTQSSKTIFVKSKEHNVVLYEINIEGCQYFIFDRSICHKGNCTNNIHQHNL